MEAIDEAIDIKTLSENRKVKNILTKLLEKIVNKKVHDVKPYQ